MPWAVAGGVIAAGGAIYAGSEQASASQNAAQTQANAAGAAGDTQLNIYGQQQQLLAPFLQSGTANLNELQYLLGTPGYNQPTGPTQQTNQYPLTMNDFVAYNRAIGSNNPVKDAQITMQNYMAGVGGGPDFYANLLNRVMPSNPDVQKALQQSQPQGQQPGAQPAGQPAGMATGGQAGIAPVGGGGNILAAGGSGPAASGGPMQVQPSTAGGFGSLTTPFSAQQFQQSPGYQFSLQQGLGAINANAAAQGLSMSPGVQAGLGAYATGTANQEYQQALQNYMAQQQQTYGMLSGQAGAGQNAAVNQGAFAGQAGSNLSSLQVGSGNALAAGQIGSANATGAGVTGAANALTNPYLLQSLYGRGGGGGVAADPQGLLAAG